MKHDKKFITAEGQGEGGAGAGWLVKHRAEDGQGIDHHGRKAL